MLACYKAAVEVYDEIAAKNEKFKKVYEPWKKFRADQFLWLRVTENTYDNFAFVAEQLAQQGNREITSLLK